MKDSAASEQSEAIHELRMKNTSWHGFLHDNEKLLDTTKLSMDRSESEVMRLMQQIRDLQKTVNVLHDSEEFKDPETCQPVRCRDKTLTCASNNNHVSEAKSAGRISHKPHDFGTTISRNFVTPLSWDPVSPILNNASVQLGKAKPSLVPVPIHFQRFGSPVTPTPASTAAAFQAAAPPLLMPNEISSKTR